MSQRRIIYWRKDVGGGRDGKIFANVHLLVGYNQGTIADFQRMADELRKTFPEAKNDEISCGKVIKSHCVQGFSLISWNAYIDRNMGYSGWEQIPNGYIEYSF